MGRQHVDHGDLVNFAQTKINLPKDKASEYRAQVRRLREKLESYLSEHPNFELKKILLSGSLAKGTALRSLNDIDVACYISGAEIPSKAQELLGYLVERLQNAFPNFKPEQIKQNTFSVTVSFKGTGLDVDVVPILYSGNPEWYGELLSQDDGTYLETCIPRHLEFIRKRKDANKQDFAQVARLLKTWAQKMKKENTSFRFKSFMIELILAKLADEGAEIRDYPEALQAFFTYIAQTALNEPIIFTDYYSASSIPASSTPVQIYDPVNPANNVASLYTARHAEQIADAALEAGDAIDAALRALTKQDTVRYWQAVFGPSFSV